MPLIVESGAGDLLADALISTADATAYHTARGNALTVTGDALDQAIRRASLYVSTAFKFTGKPLKGRAQAFAFPMTGLTDGYGNAVASDSVPIEVAHAVAEAVLIEAGSPGALNPVADPRQADVKQLTETVDVLSVSTTYFGKGNTSTINVATSKRILDLLGAFIVQDDSGTLKTTQLERS